jgi:hypothetical protein
LLRVSLGIFATFGPHSVPIKETIKASPLMSGLITINAFNGPGMPVGARRALGHISQPAVLALKINRIAHLPPGNPSLSNELPVRWKIVVDFHHNLAIFLSRVYLEHMFTAFEFCIPIQGIKVPSGPEWLHEIKYDGYRLRVERDGDRVRLITRGGYDWTKRFPWIAEAALKNRQKHFVIDGEAVILGVDGYSDFNALHSGKHNEEVQLCAFDVLAMDGDDLRDLPLSMRKANLARAGPVSRGLPDGIGGSGQQAS